MASDDDKQKRLTSREILSDVKDSLFTRNRWDRWVTLTTAIATLVIATATIIYTVTTQSMLSQIKRQADQTNRVIARMDTANTLYKTSVARQDSNVMLQRNYIKLQGDYYERTVRPFVYAHSLKLATIDTPITEDSKLVLQYSIKNVGALPAKDIYTNGVFFTKSSDDFKTRSFKSTDWKEGTVKYITGLFPEQNTIALLSKTDFKRKAITVKSLQDKKWIHFLIVYKGFNNKEYFFKWIVEARTLRKNNKFYLTGVNIWVDFS